MRCLLTGRYRYRRRSTRTPGYPSPAAHNLAPSHLAELSGRTLWQQALMDHASRGASSCRQFQLRTFHDEPLDCHLPHAEVHERLTHPRVRMWRDFGLWSPLNLVRMCSRAV